MKIGYSVEGSTDRALIEGLRQRWCPQARLVEGHFRGTTGQSRRREIPAISLELEAQGVDCMIFLTDSDVSPWKDVLHQEESRCSISHRHLSVFGVCLRNVESWLSSDLDYIANYFHRARKEFAVEDPKGVVESAFGVTRTDKKEVEIAEFVRNAPLRLWLKNPSFREFYRSLRKKSKQLGCKLENLLDN